MQLRRSEVIRVVRNAGLPDVAEELGQELPDVVDLDRDRPVLDRYGVNLDLLVNRMGGSP